MASSFEWRTFQMRVYEGDCFDPDIPASKLGPGHLVTVEALDSGSACRTAWLQWRKAHPDRIFITLSDVRELDA